MPDLSSKQRQQFEMACMYIRQGRLNLAKLQFDNLILKVNDINVLKAAYSLYRQIGEELLSVECAVRMVKSDPSNVLFAIGAAQLLEQTGQINRAIEILNLALKNCKEKLQVAEVLASLYFKTSNFRYAEKIINQFLKDYTSSSTLLLKANVLTELRKEQEAVEVLERLIFRDPKHFEATFNLASLKSASGNLEQAAELFEKSFQLGNRHVESLVRLAYLKKVSCENSNILSRLKSEIKQTNHSAYENECLNYALGKTLDDLGHYQEAMECYRTANQLNADRIGVYSQALDLEKLNNYKVLVEKLKTNHEISMKTPVFIIGHFRSGSTLVEQILSSHSHFNSRGEVDFFLREQAQFLKPMTKKELSVLCKGYLDSINSEEFAQEYFTDKRPENFWFVGFIKAIFPNAKFILTRRSFPDNALSIYFQQLSDSSQFACNFKSISEYDSVLSQVMDFWKLQFGSDILDVQYEELVEKPEQIAKNMIEFVGVDWEDTCLDFTKRKNFVRTASVSQVRQGIYKSSVKRIDNYLPYLETNEIAYLKL